MISVGRFNLKIQRQTDGSLFFCLYNLDNKILELNELYLFQLHELLSRVILLTKSFK